MRKVIFLGEKSLSSIRMQLSKIDFSFLYCRFDNILKFNINISLSKGTITDCKFSILKENSDFKIFNKNEESFLLILQSSIAITNMILKGNEDSILFQDKLIFFEANRGDTILKNVYISSINISEVIIIGIDLKKNQYDFP